MMCLSFIIYHLSFSVACSHAPENPMVVNELPKIYPDYIGVTIPAEIAPLNFNAVADDIDAVDVVV